MLQLAFFILLQSPPLRIAAPPELAVVQRKLEAIESKRFDDIAQTVGLKDSSTPIQIVLAPESAAVAQEVAPWIAGFASTGPGESEMVVIFPARTPSYPNSSLEDVLRHEVAHILIGRASAHRPIPRWFNEGLAMSVERGWRFQDEGQMLYQLATGSRSSLEALDQMFAGEQSDVTRAYALSGALVHDLLKRHGTSIGVKILARMDNGASFDHAFTQSVGMTPAEAEEDFWNRQYTLSAWLPTLTSTATLWIAVTALALLAIGRRIMKDRAMRRRWEEEDSEGDDSDASIN